MLVSVFLFWVFDGGDCAHKMVELRSRYERRCRMSKIAKVIGRIIALLVDRGVITREDAVWVLEPMKGDKEE